MEQDGMMGTGMRKKEKTGVQDILTRETVEDILAKACARLRLDTGLATGFLKPETVFRTLRDKVWETLLRKATKAMGLSASAPNAETIVCTFLKEGLPRRAVRHRFPGVFTIQLTNSRFEITKDLPTEGGFSYRARPKGKGFSSGDVVRLAWWMDSQVPLIRSRADEIIRKARQREMIRKIEAVARKNGGTTAYRDAEEEIQTL